MLIEPNLSRDSSRALTCLVEGEASLFSVVAPGGMSIRSFKNLIHKTNPDLARNLRLLKVSYVLEQHKRCGSLFYALSGRRGPQIS